MDNKYWERDYLTFVLGYDLLNDYMNENVYYCDDVYDACHCIATEFIDSKTYQEEEVLKYSSYELLDRKSVV